MRQASGTFMAGRFGSCCDNGQDVWGYHKRLGRRSRMSAIAAGREKAGLAATLPLRTTCRTDIIPINGPRTRRLILCKAMNTTSPGAPGKSRDNEFPPGGGETGALIRAL